MSLAVYLETIKNGAEDVPSLEECQPIPQKKKKYLQFPFPVLHKLDVKFNNTITKEVETGES